MARFAPIQKPSDQDHQLIKDEYEHGYAADTAKYTHISKPGLNKRTVEEISHHKSEPAWMRKFRLEAHQKFTAKPTPTWGGNLNVINYDKIHYYLKPTDKLVESWEEVPQEIKTTFDRLGIPEAERNVLAGVKAQYDCLRKDVRVLTQRGSIQIKDIKVGDTVYSLNETSKNIVQQKVVAKQSKGRRKIFKLTAAGRTLYVTENHPFLNIKREIKKGKQRGNFIVEWKYLSDLKKDDYIAVLTKFPDTGSPYKFKNTNNLFAHRYQGKNQTGTYPVVSTSLYHRTQPNLKIPQITTEAFMWFLGFFVGDGIVTRTTRNKAKDKVDLAISSKSKELRTHLQRIVREVFGYEFDKYQNKDPDRTRILSKPITQFLIKIGFDGTAKNKSLPEWLFTLPKAQRCAFIAGYVDADGTFRADKKHRDCTITSANKSLLEQTQSLAIDAGLHTSNIFSFTSTSFGKERVGYRLIISGNLSSLSPYSIKLKHKNISKSYYHRYRSAYKSSIKPHIGDDYGFARITSIEPAGFDEVYDIEVKGDHNFIAQGIIAHNSEVVYGSLQNLLQKQGVIFLSMDEALEKHEDLVKEHFGTVIPSGDNKFAALNSAVWSGGSFVYVPKGVEVKLPLQAYFRINAPNAGQFERTLIIADEGSKVHYVEGCTAPAYSSESLHSAVVEIIVKPCARVQYTTVQNWYKTVYNLVTKRAYVEEEGEMVWTDFNMGSKLTMKYPSFILAGKGARGETLSMALAGESQHQDTGSKAMHLAPHTSSTIISKSIAKGGGRTSYRGMVSVGPKAHHCKSRVVCDALLLDEHSRSDTYPTNRIFNNQVKLEHEASVSKIGEEQLFYLMSRGLTEQNAGKMIVSGFVAPLIKKLPLEYAVEMNRLIDMEMEGSIG